MTHFTALQGILYSFVEAEKTFQGGSGASISIPDEKLIMFQGSTASSFVIFQKPITRESNPLFDWGELKSRKIFPQFLVGSCFFKLAICLGCVKYYLSFEFHCFYN
eukprot:Sdes_comp19884_c0_seq1m12202